MPKIKSLKILQANERDTQTAIKLYATGHYPVREIATMLQRSKTWVQNALMGSRKVIHTKTLTKKTTKGTLLISSNPTGKRHSN